MDIDKEAILRHYKELEEHVKNFPPPQDDAPLKLLRTLVDNLLAHSEGTEESKEKIRDSVIIGYPDVTSIGYILTLFGVPKLKDWNKFEP